MTMKYLKSFFGYIYNLLREIYRRCRSLCILIYDKKYYDAETYFPEFSSNRKSKYFRFIEQIFHILKYGSPNEFYFLYGFDIKNFKDQNEYVDYTIFMERRRVMNNKYPFPPIPVLRDKSLFGIVANAYNIETPENIGIITKGNIFVFSNKEVVDFKDFVETSVMDVFMKKIDGECADGVYHLKSDKISYTINSENTSSAEIYNIVKNGVFLLQSCIKSQHKGINAIFPNSVNTIRLVTINDFRENRIFPLTAVLRVGTGHNCVDNWAAGGLSIGIDIASGTLKKYGFYKPGYGTKATEHPDTGFVFEGYKIPYFEEALEMALKYHRILRSVHSIGWDIAILDNGPTIIEGNDNWEISLMEISNGGLKKEFNKYFYA